MVDGFTIKKVAKARIISPIAQLGDTR